MPEYWEIETDTPEKLKKKCANRYCQIYCDIANRCLCNMCNQVFCIKCRLYDTHQCEGEKREKEKRDSSQNNILFDDLAKYEEIHKKETNVKRKINKIE